MKMKMCESMITLAFNFLRESGVGFPMVDSIVQYSCKIMASSTWEQQHGSVHLTVYTS